MQTPCHVCLYGDIALAHRSSHVKEKLMHSFRSIKALFRNSEFRTDEVQVANMKDKTTMKKRTHNYMSIFPHTHTFIYSLSCNTGNFQTLCTKGKHLPRRIISFFSKINMYINKYISVHKYNTHLLAKHTTDTAKREKVRSWLSAFSF